MQDRFATLEGSTTYCVHFIYAVQMCTISPMMLKQRLIGKTVRLNDNVEVDLNNCKVVLRVDNVVQSGGNLKYKLCKRGDCVIIDHSTQIIVDSVNQNTFPLVKFNLSPSFVMHHMCGKDAQPFLSQIQYCYNNSKYASILLTGGSGSGKTILIDAIAKHYHMKIVWMKTYELFVGTSLNDLDNGGGEFACQKWIHICNSIINSKIPIILCIDDIENLCLDSKLVHGDEIYKSIYEVSDHT